MKALFVLKYREDPYHLEYGASTWGDKGHGNSRLLSSGLFNSAHFVVDMLVKNKVRAKLVHVIDNNAIHKEIVDYSNEPGGPVTHVIIEAFWVVPEKFDVLREACPGVEFVIRNHSEAPFLAQEGIAFDWALRYVDKENVAIACNADRMLQEMRFLVEQKHEDWSEYKLKQKVPYLPNYYPLDTYQKIKPWNDPEFLDVGCFGAIRPLKNHVVQAIAAIMFADKQGKKLRFHINGSRVEGNGQSILHNLRGIFNQYPEHELIEHGWFQHEDFKYLVSQMDMVLQVSFSETFNIVAADAVSQDVPVVTSKEVAWGNSLYHADPTSSEDICGAMERAWYTRWFFWKLNLSLDGLKKYNTISERAWLKFFGVKK